MPNTKRAIKRATEQPTAAATIRKRDWATYTPDPHGYALIMTAPNQHCETQDVEITSEEFIALKAHLADLRGIAMPEVVHA